jgi:hypothetical protein
MLKIEKEKITTLARQFYPEHGQNSWDHVSQVTARMGAMTKVLEDRELTSLEFAAGMLHDCSVHTRQSKEQHGYWSAEIADRFIRKLSIFTWDELQVLHRAIWEHELLDKTNGPWSSQVGDLLASGDANPPDLAWILNKSWCWGITHGLSEEERVNNIITRMPKIYGSSAPTGYPQHYRRYYGERLIDMQHAFDNLTSDSVYQIVFDYRSEHGLIGDEVRMPDED